MSACENDAPKTVGDGLVIDFGNDSVLVFDGRPRQKGEADLDTVVSLFYSVGVRYEDRDSPRRMTG